MTLRKDVMYYIKPDKESVSEPDSEDNGEAEFNPLVTIEMAQSSAQEGLVNFVSTREAYEFQDMVAALLRSMGYHTPFVAPRGPDGGVDIIAYRDPLGTSAPRISVQVKQRPDSKASVQEVRELSGLLRRDGDTGLFVSTGGFAKDALNLSKLSLSISVRPPPIINSERPCLCAHSHALWCNNYLLEAFVVRFCPLFLLNGSTH